MAEQYNTSKDKLLVTYNNSYYINTCDKLHKNEIYTITC